MKQYLIALALMLSLHAGAAGVQPRHRHHATVTAVDSTAKEAVEAFSDTTSADLAGSEDTVYTSQSVADDWETTTPAEEFFGKLIGGTLGAGGVIIVILVLLAILLCALAPFVVLALLIRYFINQHNNRVALAQKAMETGQPIPDEMKPLRPESSDYYLKRGVRNIALGVGLALMFGIWGADMLAGIGLLVACLGVGQVVIAKISK